MASAMALALKKNPSLAGYSAEIRARDAAALQAGLFPNPELGVEMENFGGKDDLEGVDGAETTIAFSQLVELGGKRGNRSMVATLDKTLAEWDYQRKKLDVLAATAKAFVEVLVAQEQVALNGDLLKLAEQTTTAVSEKVDAGKVSPVEKSRAQIELAAARTEANKAVRELEAARRRLAGFWGGERADFSRAVGQLDDISALPDEESLKAFLSNNPDLARWAAELERSEAALRLARSEAVPDLTLSAGVRNFQETDDNAFVVGVSSPIPFFNRNQGGVSEARARVDKAQSEQRAAKVGLVTGLSDTWQSLSAAYTEAVGLRDEILPSAQSTYESTELGYREGKLDFLQMLDAQRTLFTVKRQYLLALGSYHLASTDMERLVGVPLSDIKNNKDNAK
jgi:cobalt-zinc-cadmium efflux system outer membrane protein